jgi:hypothetical protein
MAKDKEPSAGNINVSGNVSSSSIVAGRAIGDNNTVIVGDKKIGPLRVGVVGDSAKIEGGVHFFHHDAVQTATKGRVLSSEQAFERIGAAVKLNLEQLESNINQARKESNQFFKLTLVFAGLGFLIILSGVLFLVFGQTSAGIVTSISSIIPEVTASLFFSKDKELRKTIQSYHQHMLESQQILTMIDVSETIKNEAERDKMKQEIIYKVLKIDSPINNG